MRNVWRLPQCDVTRGEPGVILSRDGGATLLPAERPLTGVAYIYGLVALDKPNELVAAQNSHILKSDDAGCSWRTIGELPVGTFPPSLVAGKEGRVFGWSPHRSDFFVVEAGVLTRLAAPSNAIAGVGVDPNDSLHLRLVADDGHVFDSFDAGRTWTERGSLRIDGLLYSVAFDAANLDHMLVGVSTSGAWRSDDGGVSWNQARGFSAGERVNANIFTIVFAPSDASVVWAMGIDMTTLVKHVYRSSDGGSTFAAVVDESDTVALINGPTMAPHPRDPNVLYFVFGTWFQNYGTDLFRYDFSRRALTLFHHDLDGVDSIVFHPLDSSTMYLGAEVVRAVQ